VGKPFHYFAYGAAVSEVEVDGFTGMWRLRRVDILHDVGDSLSPLVDRGQIEGGFVQGVGWLTSEELRLGREGRLLTTGASTYKLPTLEHCPPEFHGRLLPKAAESGVIHGSKAVGEPPFMLAFSVREALRQAVAAFGQAPRAAGRRAGTRRWRCRFVARRGRRGPDRAPRRGRTRSGGRRRWPAAAARGPWPSTAIGRRTIGSWSRVLRSAPSRS
jgi:hypothetical protein